MSLSPYAQGFHVSNISAHCPGSNLYGKYRSYNCMFFNLVDKFTEVCSVFLLKPTVHRSSVRGRTAG